MPRSRAGRRTGGIPAGESMDAQRREEAESQEEVEVEKGHYALSWKVLTPKFGAL